MSELETNAYFTHRALAYISSHPHALARLAMIKLVVDTLGVDFTRPLRSTRNLVGMTCNGALIVLALFSLARHRAMALSEEERFLIRTVAIIMVSVDFGLFVVGPVGLRYGIAMYPLLWTAAAMTLLQKVRGHDGPVEAEIA